MKSIQLIFTGLVSIWILLICAGCEYDTPASLWDPDEEGMVPSATISEIVPENIAGGGVNEIEIQGTDFSAELSDNLVYFNNLQAELISAEPTRLVVYRPNLASDDIHIKVVVSGAMLLAEYAPYTVTDVLENFTEKYDDTNNVRNFTTGADGTYYVIMRDRTMRRRVAGSDEEEQVAELSERNIGDLRFGPDGNLYYIRSNNVKMYKIILETFTEELYTTLPASVSVFDYDANGVAYIAGNGSGILALTSPEDIQTVGDYSGFNCLALRVFDQAVYVLAEYLGDDTGVPAVAVWKNPILDGNGSLAEKELFLNWSESAYGEASPADIEFAANGDLYISCDDEQPIVRYVNGQIKPLYKDMIAGPVSFMDWGPDNYLYFYSDVATLADKNVYKADMGQPGAPHHGR